MVRKSLLIANPQLAKEWHPTKNDDLTPRDVFSRSHKKVWWNCKKGHEWQAVVYSRSAGNGCPFCAGQIVCDDNCLQTLNPTLAAEWHPTKNGSLTPRDVVPGTDKKVWWICNKGHSWQAAVSGRGRGRGCPYCRSAISELELRIFSEIKYLFLNSRSREKVHGKECDIYIPELNIGIEVDSLYYHANRTRQDKEKFTSLQKKGVTLINVRERGLERISNTDISFSYADNQINIIKQIISLLGQIHGINDQRRKEISSYLLRDTMANELEYMKLLEMLPSPLPGYSFQDKYAELAAEWHPTKNGTLTPKDVAPGTEKKFWWICNKGHEWKSSVYSRTKGAGCPYCAGKMVCNDNCLQTLNPTLATEWHPTKNGNLTPRNVTLYSNRKVWWQCSHRHEWEAKIANRSLGRGCPYCTSKLACDDNCLQTLNPTLATEWHPTKNGNLTPRNVTLYSNRKVWWQCYKGHEWQAIISNRVKGRGCPSCRYQ